LRAIDAHLARTGVQGHAVKGKFPSTYKVEYTLPQPHPLISILIPNKDHAEDLALCLQSIYEKSSYPDFEVLILENNSVDPETERYYAKVQTEYPALSVVRCEGAFNFSAINNVGRKAAKGEYLVLLNNDIEILSEHWIEEMLGLCSQPEVGICGALLYYPDDTMQHAGVITGLGGFAGHSHKYLARGHSGYMFRTATVQDLSCVTAAMLMVKRSVYDEVGGLDEAFCVAFNDVDFCLRVRKAGYSVVFTPYAEAYHYESKSRGLDKKGEAKERFDSERARLAQRWGKSLLHDPFYNPNLTLDMENFTEAAVLPKD
ncbi:MAG: glycosyltransferase family 2 protein, partial [Pygmaiobacter sp.]